MLRRGAGAGLRVKERRSRRDERRPIGGADSRCISGGVGGCAPGRGPGEYVRGVRGGGV